MPDFFNWRKLFHILNLFHFKKGLSPDSAPAPNYENTHIAHSPSDHPPPIITLSTICLPISEDETDPLSHAKQAPGRQISIDRVDTRLTTYLEEQQNPCEDIAKLHQILTMQHVILEIGCGACDAALKIALNNPGWGVIATDKYDWEVPASECSHYQKVAQAWKTRQLDVQHNIPANLVILRAETEMMRFMPYHCIDSVLLVNPEPVVGKACIELLSGQVFLGKIKNSRRQIVVVPFSRDMGWVTCGGYEFGESDQWPMGLEFIMASVFKFQKTTSVQWGIDLRDASPYSKNSTQTNVYLYGNDL